MNILQEIFSDHYEEMVYTLHPRDAVIENVKKMIYCGDPAFGGAMLFGFMFSRIEEPVKLGNEWICHSTWVQNDHAADPFDAFTKPTNNRSMLYFCEMMDCIQGTEWAEKVPKELPIYNIAGDLDPVGNWGEGVYQTTNWLAETGHKVKTKLYSGYRHEIHNYDEIKAEVEAGIVRFFKDCLK